MGKSLDTTEFINRATKKHGNRYSYDKSEYFKYKQKLIIVCPKHGEFHQTPSDHLNGSGCMECGGRKQLTTEEFVKKASKKHNNKYDYSLVEYTTGHGVVRISCPKHGEFSQKAYSHLTGHGCLDCTGLRNYNTKSFIEEAKSIHDNRYDYTLVDYINNSTKIEIVCPEHGSFIQTPNNHLTGYGCNACGYVVSSNATRSTTEDFINRAIQVHGHEYDYSKVEYIATHTQVCIVCKKHGSFYQKPNTHLNGHGCQQCNNLGGYDYNRLTTDPDLVGVDGCLYLVELSSDDEQFYKIGIARNVKSRLSSMTSHYNKRLIEVVDLKLLTAFILEQNIICLHTQYTPQYNFAGHTECLQLSDAELNELLDMMTTVDDNMEFELLRKTNV